MKTFERINTTYFFQDGEITVRVYDENGTFSHVHMSTTDSYSGYFVHTKDRLEKLIPLLEAALELINRGLD